MRTILFLLLVILIVSCSRNHNTEKIIYFDKTGNIKEKFIFPDKKDTSTFHYFSYYPDGIVKEEYSKQKGLLSGEKKDYYSNGNLHSIINFIKGKADGIVMVYSEKGNIVMRKTYKNNELHGITTKYHKDNNQQDLLFIHYTPIIRVDKGKYIDKNDSAYGESYSYFNHHDSIFVPIGSLMYKLINGQKIKDQIFCNYFETIGKDTIENGEVLNIKIISNLGLNKGHQIKLFMGEIGENYNFVDSSNIKVYESNTNILDITISQNQYNLGINLITGKIRVYEKNKDITQDYMISKIDNLPYIFYKQFYIKEKD